MDKTSIIISSNRKDEPRSELRSFLTQWFEKAVKEHEAEKASIRVRQIL